MRDELLSNVKYQDNGSSVSRALNLVQDKFFRIWRWVRKHKWKTVFYAGKAERLQFCIWIGYFRRCVLFWNYGGKCACFAVWPSLVLRWSAFYHGDGAIAVGMKFVDRNYWCKYRWSCVNSISFYWSTCSDQISHILDFIPRFHKGKWCQSSSSK